MNINEVAVDLEDGLDLSGNRCIDHAPTLCMPAANREIKKIGQHDEG